MGRMVTNPATRKMPLFPILSLWQRQSCSRNTIIKEMLVVIHSMLSCIGFKQ